MQQDEHDRGRPQDHEHAPDARDDAVHETLLALQGELDDEGQQHRGGRDDGDPGEEALAREHADEHGAEQGGEPDGRDAARSGGHAARLRQPGHYPDGIDIYLDIDGVLLDGGAAADGAAEFIRVVVETHPDTTYWLTTRCSGDAAATVAQLEPHFDAATLDLLRRVKPTTWPLVKTQAIDFTREFLWFDDILSFVDEEELERRDVIRSFILVDLAEEPDQLRGFVRDFPAP